MALALRSQEPRSIILLSCLARWSIMLMVGSGLGCASQQSPALEKPAVAQGDPAGRVGQPSIVDASDQDRLEELWNRRTSDSSASDFSLGPGDLLAISVPLEQLEHCDVRVSALDTITLPILGVVGVKGLSEQGLTDVLRQRLSKYMYDPPVSLFVKHYGNREVAVMGAVDKPGLYTLSSESDTLMGMIGKAGGMTPDAAAKIMFLPAGSAGRIHGHAEPLDMNDVSGSATHAVDFTTPNAPMGSSVSNSIKSNPRKSERVGSIQPILADTPHSHAPSDLLARASRLHPLIIFLNDPGMRSFLDLPARPGDTIIIPASGEVTVGGWVKTPGAFKITPGMTALSAISAAGGAMFSDSAEVLRAGSDGGRASTRIDIANIQQGKDADIPVQSGDVVVVDKSVLGAVPYSLYTLMSKFGTGMYLPIP